jgi:hypothetical protein
LLDPQDESPSHSHNSHASVHYRATSLVVQQSVPPRPCVLFSSIERWHQKFLVSSSTIWRSSQFPSAKSRTRGLDTQHLVVQLATYPSSKLSSGSSPSQTSSQNPAALNTFPQGNRQIDGAVQVDKPCPLYIFSNARRRNGAGSNGESHFFYGEKFSLFYVSRRAREPYFSIQRSLSVCFRPSIRPLQVDGAAQMGDESRMTRDMTIFASMRLPTSLPSTAQGQRAATNQYSRIPAAGPTHKGRCR